ncbi:riboflavin kinase, partial [bacterium]|nr:riboflavin kinase [bacterium]
IRDEINFESKEALSAQIKKDIKRWKDSPKMFHS